MQGCWNRQNISCCFRIQKALVISFAFWRLPTSIQSCFGWCYGMTFTEYRIHRTTTNIYLVPINLPSKKSTMDKWICQFHLSYRYNMRSQAMNLWFSIRTYIFIVQPYSLSFFAEATLSRKKVMSQCPNVFFGVDVRRKKCPRCQVSAGKLFQ